MLAGQDEFEGTERFRIRRRLGAGGMGVVYEAHDRERDQVVALKTLRSADAHSLFRFKSEFRALADLEHPNLARLGELFCERGQWFFTMELLRGQDFLDWVWADARRRVALETLSSGDTAPAMASAAGSSGPRPALDVPRLRGALAQLATGVAALHDAGKIHRDIKPSNILVTEQGRVVLLDFGLITDLATSGLSTDHPVVGTPQYMAPEQAASRPVGPEADWYSVGSVLYEALTGTVPFVGLPLQILMDKQRREPTPPSRLARDVPEDLDQLCVELLRTDARARPPARSILGRLGVMPIGERIAAPSLTQSPRFVGRAGELAELETALAAMSQGGAVTAAVHGESGFGKSALARRFLDELEGEPNTVVLAGRCYERESMPYKAFDGIIDALTQLLRRSDAETQAVLLPRDVGALARVFPVLRRVPAMAKAVDLRIASPLELRARAFAALRELFARLAERKRLILYIDDFQWADADSLALLAEIMRPPDAPTMLLLLTVRASEEPREILTSVPGTVRLIRVGSLPRDEAEALTRLLLGQAGVGNDADVDTIVKESEGHPLFIRELVWHLGSAAGLTVALRLDEALAARVSRLDAPVRRLLEVIAIAGAPLPQRVLAAAADLSPGEVSGALGVLRAANLVRTRGVRDVDAVEPYHDRVREAVANSLDAEPLRRHHGRLADAFEMIGAAELDPEVLLTHLEAAGHTERAATLARRAARLATETLAFDRAIQLYQSALRLGQHSEGEERELRIALADALVNGGRAPEAADAYLSAVAGANAATRLDCQRRAAEQLLMSGHLARGLEALESVLAEIGERLAKTPKRALASVLWNRVKLRLRGLRWKERDESEIAASDLTRLDIYKSVAVGLGMIDNIRAADFQVRFLLLSLRTGERTRLARSLAQEAMYLSSQGRKSLVRARHLIAEATRLSKESGQPYLEAWTLGASGLNHYYSCELPAALDELERGETIFRDQTTGANWEFQTCRIFIMFVLRFMGAYKDMARRLPDYIRDAARRGDRYAHTTLVRAGYPIWLASDRADELERELDQKQWSPPETGYHLQHWYELRTRVDLDLYRGDGAGTRVRLAKDIAALHGSVYQRLQGVRAESHWMLARLAMVEAAAGGAGAKAALSEAENQARSLERERIPYAGVWAQLTAGAVAARRGQKEAAIAAFREAVARADKVHMAGFAAAGRLRLAELGDSNADKLRARALEWAAGEGVRNPERFFATLSPAL